MKQVNLFTPTFYKGIVYTQQIKILLSSFLRYIIYIQKIIVVKKRAIKKIITKKIVLSIELCIILLMLLLLYATSKPKLLTPSSGLVIEDFDFNFEIENAEIILISKDLSFQEKILLERGKEVILIPGTYYWKAVSFWGESEVRNFTITASLILSLEEKDGKYEILNKGNVDANVSNGDSRIIQPKTSSAFEQEGNFEGRQA